MSLTAEDQMAELMDMLKIPVEKRNFKELKEQIQILNAYYQSKNDNTLEKIFNNPGLHHLAEKIVNNLNYEDWEMVEKINQSSKQIVEYQKSKPMFVLKKFIGLSEENQKNWIKVIESEKNSGKKKAISAYLLWKLKKNVTCACKKESLLDLPCYTSPVIKEDFMKKIWECCKKKETSDEDTEIVKILAPLMDNPNPPDKDGQTPIMFAAWYGHTEIVKILAPLTENTNISDNHGRTPIHRATHNRHTEIVNILAHLTNNRVGGSKFFMGGPD